MPGYLQSGEAFLVGAAGRPWGELALRGPCQLPIPGPGGHVGLWHPQSPRAKLWPGGLGLPQDPPQAPWPPQSNTLKEGSSGKLLLPPFPTRL